MGSISIPLFDLTNEWDVKIEKDLCMDFEKRDKQ
jgi:hypothetical protein